MQIPYNMHIIKDMQSFLTVIDLNSNFIFFLHNFNYYNTNIRSKMLNGQYWGQTYNLNRPVKPGKHFFSCDIDNGAGAMPGGGR